MLSINLASHQGFEIKRVASVSHHWSLCAEFSRWLVTALLRPVRFISYRREGQTALLEKFFDQYNAARGRKLNKHRHPSSSSSSSSPAPNSRKRRMSLAEQRVSRSVTPGEAFSSETNDLIWKAARARYWRNDARLTNIAKPATDMATEEEQLHKENSSRSQAERLASSRDTGYVVLPKRQRPFLGRGRPSGNKQTMARPYRRAPQGQEVGANTRQVSATVVDGKGIN
ncbi:hypothetical protein RRG08_021014 [Elysia crispata]|uniref:Uncharacterized protein n=1 Tax=Elysia crispata TaxID=231223 RepID=A0AAE1BEQ3_9GAST|nr:hypothetical protein RRG08_021014 [Elysia crispata]